MKYIFLMIILLYSASCTNLNFSSKEKKKSTERQFILEDINIFKSIKDKDFEAILFYLKNKESNIALDENNNTIIHLLANEGNKTDGHLKLFEYLLKNNNLHLNKNNNDEDFISILIKKGNNIDFQILNVLFENNFSFQNLDKNNNNYLINGIKYSFKPKALEIIELLLRAGLDPNNKNNDNFSPLSYLLINEHQDKNLDILELLLEYGLHMEQRMGKYNDNIIMLICNSEDDFFNIPFLRALLKNGANPNFINKKGQSPLNQLIFNDQIKNKLLIAKNLIDFGANVNYIDKNGQSPLIHIVIKLFIEDNQNLLPLLISQGANINYANPDGNTALSFAISHASYIIYYNLCELLLALGADPNHQNNFGESPVIIASKNKNADIFSINLLKHFSADLHLKDIYGNSALANAVISYKGHRERNIINFLINNEADIYEENIFHYNPLMLAIYYLDSNGIEAFKELLPYYKDLNKFNSFGYTPLMLASHYGNSEFSIEVIDLLVENGANINSIQDNGTSSLMLAGIHANSSSSLEVLKKLVNLGADPNLELKEAWYDKEKNIHWEIGDRALELAIKYKDTLSSLEAIKFLEKITKER